MALPNFIHYYWVANIRALLYWMKSDGTDPKWVVLERSSINSTSLEALLCSNLPFKQPISTFTSNPIITHSVKIWNQFRRTFNISDLSHVAPIVKNHMFPPSVTDKVFNIWFNKGICTLYDLYVENTFASFEQLSRKFIIHKSHFYRYMQLRDFVVTNSKSRLS